MSPSPLLLLFSIALVLAQDSSSSSTGMAESSSSSTAPAPAPAPAPPAGNVNTYLMASFEKPSLSTNATLLIDKGVAVQHSKKFEDVEYYTIIYFWLLADAPKNTQNFTANFTSAVKIRSIQKYAPIHPVDAQLTELQIRYINCDEDDSGTYPVEATITPLGYDDIKLDWLKECLPENKPYVDSGGMSGAEKFFLVVFILITVFCVAGCGYNYISRGRSGWEVIPFHDYLCCKNQRRYSPRMDYDQPIGDDDSYGASYSADL